MYSAALYVATLSPLPEKTISISFRVSPRFKELLEAAAAASNRSQTNMVEHLLFEHCKQQGLHALEKNKSKGIKSK